MPEPKSKPRRARRYSLETPQGRTFVGDEITKAEKDGWVDSPAKLPELQRQADEAKAKAAAAQNAKVAQGSQTNAAAKGGQKPKAAAGEPPKA